MDTLLIEKFLETNTINFIIMVSLLVFIFKKARLGTMIDKIADDIKNNVEKSEMSVEEALKEYEETKIIVKDTPQLQETIIKKAQDNAQNIKEKIESQTNSIEKELNDSLEKIYQNQNDKIKKTTIKEIYLACVDIAQEEVVKKLDENIHRKLINTSIDEIDRIEGSLSWTRI